MRGAPRFLLQLQQHFAFLPELLKGIVGTLIGGEEMHDDIPVVDDHPALSGFSLFPPMSIMLVLYRVKGGLRQGIQHPVAGSRAQDEVVRKRGNVPDVEQKDILALL